MFYGLCQAQELKKTYHENGQLASEGKMENGNPVGVWKFYYEEGQLSKEGSFNNGMAHGEWKTYYPSGELFTTGTFSNGNLIGVFKTYMSGEIVEKATVDTVSKKVLIERYHIATTGKLSEIGFLNENGESQGEWKSYYYNGKLETIGNYNNGKKSGEWKSYNNEGDLVDTEEYKDGVPQTSLYVKAAKVFGSLSNDDIKKDVISKSVFTKIEYAEQPNIVKGWKFENESEFLDVKIISAVMDIENDYFNDRIIYYDIVVSFLVQDPDMKNIIIEKARLRYSYSRTGGKKLSAINADKIEKTKIERL
ncbi:MAG: toxin-antitoxin system YwqK family antitoxin [Flavobacteriaceae bacterium]|nr:toxin-antitoxin system YwqK family antitoxin [Flavobacteriaceae bacterium]